MRITQMKRMQSGFTLIELVVVIVILGILAAVAVPRFMDVSTEARTASVNGMLGAVRSAASLAHAQAVVQNQTDATGTITMEGVTVNLVHGYPATAAGGINNALNFEGYTYASGVFSQTGAPTPATCGVTYAQPTAAGGSPTITPNLGGC